MKIKYTGLILAAGEGARAGGFKPLWALGNQPVIDWAIAAASSVCDEVRVVGGAAFDELKRHLKTKHPKVVLLNNSIWQQGMFSSVKLGLGDLRGPVFIHPADIPGADASVYQALARVYERGRQTAVLKPVCNGRPGHPILLGEPAVHQCQREPLGSDLRRALASFSHENVAVVNPLIHRDFDTVEQFEWLKDQMVCSALDNLDSSDKEHNGTAAGGGAAKTSKQ